MMFANLSSRELLTRHVTRATSRAPLRPGMPPWTPPDTPHLTCHHVWGIVVESGPDAT
jgi:hypothetical protein